MKHISQILVIFIKEKKCVSTLLSIASKSSIISIVVFTVDSYKLQLPALDTCPFSHANK